MNHASKRRSGQPVVVLGALLIGWVFLRVALWETPFPIGFAAHQPFVSVKTAANEKVPARLPANEYPADSASPPIQLGQSAPIPAPLTIGVDTQPFNAAGEPHVQGFASQQLLWLAAMGKVPVPGEVLSVMQANARASTAAAPFGGMSATALSGGRAAVGADPKRWSADGWLFLRPGSQDASATRFSSYGASQAGAVLRYRLRPESSHQPSVYLRGTKALAAARETDVALGLSVRPIARIPVAAHAEMRVTRRDGSNELRPAAFLVTQLPPASLPHGLRGEAYAQAGYVGGTFKTAFVDGQAKVDHKVAQFDLGTLRAGAGAWGGAQKGAARLDIGPTASVETQLGQLPARIMVDYRLRVAGDAKPGSGVALTLTTGF